MDIATLKQLQIDRGLLSYEYRNPHKKLIEKLEKERAVLHRNLEVKELETEQGPIRLQSSTHRQMRCWKIRARS